MANVLYQVILSSALSNVFAFSLFRMFIEDHAYYSDEIRLIIIKDYYQLG